MVSTENYMVTGFGGGNLEQWAFYQTVYVPKFVDYLVKVVDASMQAALIQLLGSSDKFEKVSGVINPVYTQDGCCIQGARVSLTYKSSTLRYPDAQREAIEHDQEFLQRFLDNVAKEAQVALDTKSGNIVVTLTAKIGS